MAAQSPFDPASLDPDARELWNIGARPGGGSKSVTASDLLGFAYICTLDLGAIPAPVQEALDALDPEHQVGRYFDRVRCARFPRGR